MYFGSFLIMELIGAIARWKNPKQVPTDFPGNEEYRYSRSWTASGSGRVVALVTLSTSIGIVYVPFATSIVIITRAHWLNVLFIMCTFLLNSICCVIVMATRFLSDDDSYQVSSWPLIMILSPFSIFSFDAIARPIRLLAVVSDGKLSIHSVNAAVSILLILLTELKDCTTILAVNFVVSTTEVVLAGSSFWGFGRGKTGYLNWENAELELTYFMLHLVTVFLVYAILYEPSSTSKSSWTELLG